MVRTGDDICHRQTFLITGSYRLHTAHVHLLNESWLNVFLSSRLHIQPKHQNDSESVIKGIIFPKNDLFIDTDIQERMSENRILRGFRGARVSPTTLYT